MKKVELPIEPDPCTKCWKWMTPFRWLNLNLFFINITLATSMILKLIKLLGRFKMCNEFCSVKEITDCKEYPDALKENIDIEELCKMEILKLEIIIVGVILALQLIAGKKRLKFNLFSKLKTHFLKPIFTLFTRR